MENGSFEDICPIQNGDFPLLCSFTGGGIIYFPGVFFFAASFKHPQPTATTAPLRLRYSQSAEAAAHGAVWGCLGRMQTFCWEKHG